ncbi:MAG: alpha-ketoglutarate-dependent dioxygenase AlkB [Flavitalea sp.]
MNLMLPIAIKNLLPYDGEVEYFGKIINEKESLDYLGKLMNNIEWKNDEAYFFGKHIITKRKVGWYGNAGYAYTYSNATKTALAWTNELLALKTLTEHLSNATYNSCLLNLYHNGLEGMAWHSDDEKALSNGATIASLTFGAERKFSFKHKKTGEKLTLLLENGSLLLMKGATQANWLHCLHKSTRIEAPRLNLTFRSMAH